MDQDNTTLKSQERTAVGRRSVIKGVAWSVPVVAVVGATPAFADSNLAPAPVSLSSTNPDKTGQRTFTWTIKNKNTARSITGITVMSGSTPWLGGTSITAGSEGSYTLVRTDSATFSFTIAYTLAGVNGSRTFTVQNLKNKAQTYTLSTDTYTGSN